VKQSFKKLDDSNW